MPPDTLTSTRLELYELRWVSGPVEGVCWIRALDIDDAIGELQQHASWYGCATESPLVVLARRVRRVRSAARGRL